MPSIAIVNVSKTLHRLDYTDSSRAPRESYRRRDVIPGAFGLCVAEMMNDVVHITLHKISDLPFEKHFY